MCRAQGTLWQRRSGRLSTQVLSEYYVNATRTLKLPQGDARAKVRRFQVWQPWQTDHQNYLTPSGGALATALVLTGRRSI